VKRSSGGRGQAVRPLVLRRSLGHRLRHPFSHPFRHRLRHPALAVAAALCVVAGATGCSFTSAKTTATTYAASDGVNAEIAGGEGTGAVRLLNMLLVSAEKGEAGALVGAVSNEGTSPVTVNFIVLDPSGQSQLGTGVVTAAPRALTKIGGDGTAVTVPSVPVVPGSNLRLQATTSAGGSQLTLPVMEASGPYASYAPSVSESATESATEPASEPSGSAEPSPSASQ
jgi:hypothetical protein